jgi:chorismate-pyruvate lyase
MNTSTTFIKIWNLNINENIERYRKVYPSIPLAYKIFLTSDGSFTRNLNITKGHEVFIKLVKQEQQIIPTLLINNQFNTLKKHNCSLSREIWLMNNKEIFMTFAKSYYKKKFLTWIPKSKKNL